MKNINQIFFCIILFRISSYNYQRGYLKEVPNAPLKPLDFHSNIAARGWRGGPQLRPLNAVRRSLRLPKIKCPGWCTHINLFEILSNEPEIRLYLPWFTMYLPLSDLIWIQTAFRLDPNQWEMVNTIWFNKISKIFLCVCEHTWCSTFAFQHYSTDFAPKVSVSFTVSDFFPVLRNCDDLYPYQVIVVLFTNVHSNTFFLPVNE